MEKITLIDSLPSSRWKEYRDLMIQAGNATFGYTKKEIDALNEMSADFFTDELENKFNLAILFAENSKKQLVGMIYLSIQSTGFGFIRNLFVNQKYHNQGIGSKLVEGALYKFHISGIDTIEVEILNKEDYSYKVFKKSNFKDSEIYKNSIKLILQK